MIWRKGNPFTPLFRFGWWLVFLLAALLPTSVAWASTFENSAPYSATGAKVFSVPCGNLNRDNAGLGIYGVPPELLNASSLDGARTSVRAVISSVRDPANASLVGEVRKLGYGIEAGAEAAARLPDGSVSRDVLGLFPTASSVGLDGNCTIAYIWAFKMAEPTPVPLSWRLALSSAEASGSAPANNGQIALDGKIYNLASLSDPLPSGTHTVEYLPGGPNDSFHHWGAAGGVAINSNSANPATITVSAGGDLVAYYRRDVPTPPPSLKADLVISSISWSPAAPVAGDNVTISYTAENRGAAWSGDFGNGLLIDGAFITVSARDALAAGQSRSQRFFYDWRPTSGAHTITVQADWEGVIAETDEANNGLTRNLSVGASPLGPASLSVLNSPIKTMDVLRYRFSGFQPNSPVNIYVLGYGGLTNTANAAGNGTSEFLNGDPPGQYTLVAEDHFGHRATATFQITSSGPVAVTIRVPEASGTAGQPVRLKATINGQDLALLPHPLSGQTLQFFVSDASAGRAVTDSSGEATISYTPLLSGFLAIKVVYAGNEKYQAATGTGTLRVQSQPLPTISGLTPNAGPPSGGTRVTIRGAGFTGATGVRFGGAAASNFALISDQEIVATSPAGVPEMVEVQVVTSAGRSGPCVVTPICAAAFTYQNRTNVELTAPDGSGKAGETVTLRATLKGMVAAPEGIPLSGQEIRFYVGDSRVGIVTTGSGGEASVRYIPASAGAFQIRAEYPGNDKYKAATATATLRVEAPSAPPAAPPGTGRLPGEVDVIWGWDPQQQMWQIYVAGVPLLSDLNKLEYGHSYFFHAVGPVSFSYGGNTYSFVVGWNLTAWLGSTISIP